jgi:G-protein alpha subunit
MSLSRKTEGQSGPLISYLRLTQDQELDAIIFVASLAAFDQIMYEDPLINRLMDSMVCFEHIMDNAILKREPMISMFNKHDIFKDKCRTTKFHSYIPHFIGTSQCSRKE